MPTKTTTQPLDGDTWVWPLPALPDGRKPTISQAFGKRPGGAETGTHYGADVTYEANEGDGDKPRKYKGAYTPSRASHFYSPDGVPVLAVDDGEVTLTAPVESSRIRGQVYILHASGRMTRYAHLSSVTVSKGQRVQRGDVLGVMGAGAGTPFRHLHFELFNRRVKLGGKQMDPAPALKRARVLSPKNPTEGESPP